ncbi:MAG: S9 family peptidase [Bacteroidetes bacterium]|nr:S9 family peptidase [Bacteroidota bacterium]
MKQIFKIIMLSMAVSTLFASTSIAQQKTSSLKEFTYDDISAGLFRQKSVWGLRSMENGENYTATKGNTIEEFSYKTGEKTAILFDGSTVIPEIKSIYNYEFSNDESMILIATNVAEIYRHSYTAKYWIYNIADKSLTELSEGKNQEVASFSPDGSKVAFVRENNLFYVDIASKEEVQMTTDGKFNFILNGKPDWVYEEEFAFSKGYEWSKNSKNIAYYRSDEERVKEYHMNRFDEKLYPTVYSYKYPKAGEQNSIVSIYSYSLEGAKSVKMNIGDEDDQYVPRIQWNGTSLMIFIVNRLQNEFDILQCNISDGTSKVVYNEKEDCYIERLTDDSVLFLPDGDRFVVKSEKNGFMHLYLYSITSGELNAITKGDWEVVNFLGVNKDGKVFYTSTETSSVRRNLYSVNLNGKRKKRLTTGDGMYRISFNKNFSYYISYFSNTTTPNVVTLHKANGSLVRVLEDNASLKARIAEYKLPVKELMTITTEKGFELNAYILKPLDFDVNKKYPLFMTQYSGPASQQVSDSWYISWEYALVNEGYLVVCVDGRGTGFRGEEFKKCTYNNLGGLEVIDQADAAKYFAKQSYVDGSRIGIYGWSYGGFMSLNCILKHSDIFKSAIAVAPVTSWRYYDTIYTEIYNGLPQDNPAGYDDNSPLGFAKNLKGNLLIAHGSADDNVHPQNTFEMIRNLEKEGKMFDMVIYPDRNHSMYPERWPRRNLMNKCIFFVKEKL